MNVKLIRHTPDPDSIIALAASQCYSEGFVGDGRIPQNNLILKILDNGHLSVLEHASFTFAVEGISRACSHQLVRHRLASFSQQNQRYVEQKINTLTEQSKSNITPFPYITPLTILNFNPDDVPQTHRTPLSLFDETMRIIGVAYQKLIDAGIPPEDARFVLPNAAETKLVMTMNARELYHFFNVRCCTRAQWEIRNMADEMLRLVNRVAPMTFSRAGASCVTTGRCPEGTKGCGRI